MVHPFGELVQRYMRRKPGLTQLQLAVGIEQTPNVISLMCKGQRLLGPQARQRILAIIAWLYRKQVLFSREEADALLAAAGLIGLQVSQPDEARLLNMLTWTSHVAEEMFAQPYAHVQESRGNVPGALTRFIGRECERSAISQMLSTTQLVTLTGPGGCGKTRLALQVAQDIQSQFRDGAWLVTLDSVRDPDRVPQTCADIFSLKEQAGSTVRATLLAYLRYKHLLLILDNCQHLIDACARLVTDLLTECPELAILTTSREALGIPAEAVQSIEPLAVPDFRHNRDWQEIAHFDAVRLFVERARAVVPAFELSAENAQVVAQICQHLDGIPLAIELAAARLQILSVNDLAARLADRFHLLTNGNRTALPHQQTLHGLLDWSYDLLLEPERVLLRRLSIFRNGWTLDAAEAICSEHPLHAADVLDLMAQLVVKSLVIVERKDQQVRFRMLGTIRAYAAEHRAAAHEEALLFRRHRIWFLSLAELAAPHLRTGDTSWFHRLQCEHDNLRAVLEWSTSEHGDTETGLRMAVALWWFWGVCGSFEEGRYWLETTLSKQTPPLLRAQALLGAGNLARDQDDYARAVAMLEEALTIFQAHGDIPATADTLGTLGNVALHQGDYRNAWTLLEKSLQLRRELNDLVGIALVLRDMGTICLEQGEYEHAAVCYEEALAIRRSMNDYYGIASLLINLGVIAHCRGNVEQATDLYQEGLHLARQQGFLLRTAEALYYLGSVALLQKNFLQARELLEESLRIARELGDRRGIAFALDHLGIVALQQGNYRLAASLLQESLAIRRELNMKRDIPSSLLGLATVAAAIQDSEQAASLLQQAEAGFIELHTPLRPVERMLLERTHFLLKDSGISSCLNEQSGNEAIREKGA